MKCDVCGRDATHKTTKTEKGVTVRIKLCDLCFIGYKRNREIQKLLYFKQLRKSLRK